MALTTTHEPLAISLSKNVIYYGLTNGLLAGRGVQAGYVTPNTKIPNGNTLVINWNDADNIDYSVTFTAVANPTADNHIQDNSTADDFLTWFQLVADKIQAHPSIAPFFKTFIGDDDPVYTLTIEAKEISTDWSVEFDITGITVSQTSTTQDLTIVNSNLPANYKIHFEVFFEKSYLSNDWEQVVKLEGTPDAENKIAFQIDSILNAEIKKSYTSAPIPNISTTQAYIADNIRRYYVRYTEESGSPATKSAWTTGSIKTVLCGEIDQEEFARSNFFDGLDSSNSLLSNFPDNKEVSKTQPNYLQFYNYSANEINVNLRIFVYDEMNVQTQIVSPLDDITVKANQTAVFPIGYEELGLSTAGVDIKYYTVKVIDADTQGTDYSQFRTIIVDDAHQEHERFMLYLNAFCLPEVIRCIGEQSTDLTVTREESKKILPPDYTTTAEETIQHNEDYQVSYTYRTGYLTKAEKIALQEMIIYNDLFEIQDNGYLALYITDRSFKMVNGDRQNRFTLDFKAKPRLKKKITNADLLSAPTSWVDPANDPWVTPDGDSWIF